MRFAGIRQGLNSIKFRLLALYFSLFTLSFLAFLVFSFVLFYNVLNREEDRFVANEVADVVEQSANGTLKSLQDYCNHEIMENGFTNMIFRLRDGDREILLPSSERWSGYPLGGINDFQRIVGEAVLVPNTNGEPPLKVGTAILPNGLVMQVGIVSDSILKLKSYFSLMAAVIFLPILLAGLGVGNFMARKALGGISRVTTTATAIYDGDLSNRVERSHNGDEIDRLSETFNMMLARLQQLIGNMTEMVDNIAHDLRSPLTRLRGKLEVALLRLRSPEEYREVMESSLEDIDQLVGLISTVLNIAEAEAGTIVLNKRLVNLPRFLESLAEFYTPMSESTGVAFRLGEVDRAEVLADETRLWQACANLLENAFKFTPVGGEIVLSGKLDGAEAAIAVADTGVGIDPAERVDIFRRFYRHDAGVQPGTGKGYGLGLSLVKAIAEIHGGRAEVQCPPEGGSRFSIVLPVAQSKTVVRQSGRLPARLSLGLALAIALDTATQLLWKTGAAAAAPEATAWQAAQALLHQPVFLSVGMLMAAQYLNWMSVLDRADLSYAHSIVSLSYVTVALGSALLLGERLDPIQLLGIGFILAGVWFVGVSGRSGARVRGDAP